MNRPLPKNEPEEARAHDLAIAAIRGSCKGMRPDAVILIPPFGPRHSPALGPHIVQAVCRDRGLSIVIVYANLILADLAGEAEVSSVEALPSGWLAGERIFAASAHGLPSLGADCGEGLFASAAALEREGLDAGSGMGSVRRVESRTVPFVRGVARAVVDSGTPVVGAACSYEQLNASIALLKCIRESRDDVVTAIGGANCAGPMADGIAELAPWIDFIFSGDSESAFAELLLSLIPVELNREAHDPRGQLPRPAESRSHFRPPRGVVRRSGGCPSPTRIIRSAPVVDLDSQPLPDFTDFLVQAGTPDRALISWETSRGCRKAMSRQCSFCGLNAGETAFRQRGPDSALEGFRTLSSRHPGSTIAMTDSAMPENYFDELLPLLVAIPNLSGIHYEQRANLGLRRVCLLKRAGINEIQAGIEAISNGLLKIMGKGTTGAANIETLRLCRSTGITVRWNQLCCLPGDRVEDYEALVRLFRLIPHLHPPFSLIPVTLCRFSPYVDQPASHGISRIEPLPAYGQILPDGFDTRLVCYFYQGDYICGSREERKTLKAIHSLIERWKGAWAPGSRAPVLHVRGGKEDFTVTDTRGIQGCPQFSAISRNQAAAALAGWKSLVPVSGEAADWAITAGVAVVMDGKLVPLATARPATIAEFTGETLS